MNSTSPEREALGLSEQLLLRLKKEPCSYFDEEQIHMTLMSHAPAFMEYLERFYKEWYQRKRMVVSPKKQVFMTRGTQGDFRVMPCLIHNFEEKLIKVVKVIGTNEEENHIKDKICVGKALLIHPTDNYVEAIFDVCSFSSFRTAAISILAFKHATRIKKNTIGIIGTGRIGFYTAYILNRWLGIDELWVTDPNEKHLNYFMQSVKMRKTAGLKVGSLNDLCCRCTTIFLNTDSPVPILAEKNAAQVDFLLSVGADADNLSEFDASLVKKRDIITESRQNIAFGDLKRWHRKGLITRERLLELRELIGQKKRPNKKKLFISTGTAVQDALICHYLFEHLKK